MIEQFDLKLSGSLSCYFDDKREALMRNNQLLLAQLFVLALSVLASRMLTAELLSWMYFRDQLLRFFIIGAYCTEKLAGYLLPTSHFNLIVATVCQGFIISHVIAWAKIYDYEFCVSLVGSAVTCAMTLPYTIKSRLAL